MVWVVSIFDDNGRLYADVQQWGSTMLDYYDGWMSREGGELTALNLGKNSDTFLYQEHIAFDLEEDADEAAKYINRHQEMPDAYYEFIVDGVVLKGKGRNPKRSNPMATGTMIAFGIGYFLGKK